jgi:hypothetical protein
MLTKRTSLSIVMVFGLMSCNSFNRYEMHYTGMGSERPVNTPLPKKASQAIAQASMADERVKSTSAVETDVGAMPVIDASDATAAASAGVVCPVYQLPLLAEMPQLPYKQLEKAAGDRDAMEKVAQQHISDLRGYISRTKKTLVDSHEKYLKDCQRYLANSHQNSSAP